MAQKVEMRKRPPLVVHTRPDSISTRRVQFYEADVDEWRNSRAKETEYYGADVDERPKNSAKKIEEERKNRAKEKFILESENRHCITYQQI